VPNDRPIDELIDRCIDKTASEAARLELERRLQDPATRAEFVATQRLNVCLEALLNEETELAQWRALAQRAEPLLRRSRAQYSWTGLAGVAAAILLLFGIWLRWGGGPSPTTQVASNRERPFSQKVIPPAEISPVEAVAMFGLASAKAVK